VLGTDGLWDVLSNQEVAEAVTGFLANCDPDDQHRHVRSSSHSCGHQSDMCFLVTPALFGEVEQCYLVAIISKHLDKSLLRCQEKACDIFIRTLSDSFSCGHSFKTSP